MSKTLMVGTGFSGVGGITLLGCKRLNNISQLIKSLFANNEQGFAYDPNDLSTMYQDATGTIPVTAAGQPVGLMLDKSKGLVLGSECFNYVLNNINDGSESLGAYNAATRTLSNSSPSKTNHRPIFAFNVNNWGAGKRYVVKGTILSGHSKIYAIRFGSGVSFTTIPVGADGSFYAVTEAGSGILSIIYKLGEVGDIVLGDISVKELSGNHAYQTTSASRPVLGRMPEGGIRNILVSSGDRTHSSWTHHGGTKVLNVLDAKGTYKATRFSGASTSPPYILGTKAAKAGAHTLRIQVKSGSSNYTSALVMLRNNTTVVNYSTGLIDLVTGRITGIGWSSKELPNGFWECTFTQSTGISLDDSFNVYFGRTGITDSNFDIIVGEVQLESGTQATPYQETRGLTDVTESGKKDIYFLAFDGADDFLQTNNIDFTVTNETSLFAGVRKLSDAGTGTVCELGTAAETTKSAFVLLAPAANGSNHYNFRSYGSAGAAAGTPTVTAFPAPHSAVLRATGEISTNTCELLINGGSKQSVAVSQGTGNYGNYPLYIGRRGGTSLPFNGHIYSLIGVGRLSTDSETKAIEKELAKRTGVTLNV